MLNAEACKLFCDNPLGISLSNAATEHGDCAVCQPSIAGRLGFAKVIVQFAVLTGLDTSLHFR